MGRIVANNRTINRNGMLLALMTLLFLSCNHDTVVSEYKDVPDSGWNKDSVMIFKVNITDDTQQFNVLVNIRHESNYPYQNFWMFIAEKNPAGLVIRDTVECFLADNRGKWLGKGLSSIYTMPVLINKGKRFAPKGIYTYEIKQGMRDDLLIGIKNIGFEIIKRATN
jgi:gliding motility-associated lipoprotein GldH